MYFILILFLAETVITFEEDKNPNPKFTLKFEKNDASYYLVASESGAVASPVWKIY